MSEEKKAIDPAMLLRVMRQDFTFKRVYGDSKKGYSVNLDRCPLGIHSFVKTVSGADVLTMLAKLDEWEQDIKETREGILEIIQEQLRA